MHRVSDGIKPKTARPVSITELPSENILCQISSFSSTVTPGFASPNTADTTNTVRRRVLPWQAHHRIITATVAPRRHRSSRFTENSLAVEEFDALIDVTLVVERWSRSHDP